MKIEQINDEKRGYFVALEEEIEAGKMTYTWAGNNKLIIDHTEVNPEYGGKGVGKKLLMELVNFARENQIKVLPLCPFAKSMFDRIEAISDVRM